jgi:hypothetical protein
MEPTRLHLIESAKAKPLWAIGGEFYGWRNEAPHEEGEEFQDGVKKSGGLRTTEHAGPQRASKPRPRGIEGSQLQRRLQP